MALAASCGAIVSWCVILHGSLGKEAEENLGFVAVAMLMILLSFVGGTAAWHARHEVLYAVFLVQFVPVGLYLLGTPLGKYVGLANLLYAIGAGQLHVAESLDQKRENQRQG